MSIYKSLFDSLDNFPTLYRFQGGKSLNRIMVDRTGINLTCRSFIYVSKSLNHHQYFSLKRVKQSINLQGLSYRIKTWEDLSNAITSVNNGRLNIEATSLSIKVFPFFIDVIKDNCQVNKGNNEIGHRKIEISDRRVRGGCFGFPDEWLQLFEKSIVIVKKKNITKQSIKDYSITPNNRVDKNTERESFLEFPPHNYFVNQYLMTFPNMIF